MSSSFDHYINGTLMTYFNRLLEFFGPQYWWPGDTPFEVIIGAILTQNTTWKNVEKSIAILKQHDLLDPKILRSISQDELAQLIRSCGYYNQKAKKISHFLQFFECHYQSDIERMRQEPLDRLRNQLLTVHGIGPETADSILLYAMSKQVFVIDSYTRRIFSRHNLIDPDADYETLRLFFENNLKKELYLFNEYHALIVCTGKDFCRTKKPLCQQCPLKELLPNKS